MARFYESLIDRAKSAGFPLAGALDLDSVLTEILPQHVARYDRWLELGSQGEMEYLKRGRDRRADPRLVFREARSILCVALPYSAAPLSTGRGPRFARYLRGRDYHLEIAEKLERMMEALRQDCPDLKWKICVDTSAVLERSWAALAGLGWIGKNTLLMHPQYGSYLFLAEVLLNQPVERGPAPLPDFCGHCTRCLDACPTGAFRAPHDLDARECISYWTLENRSELPVSEEQKKKIGNWVAGCDVCQEVCPFNLKAAKSTAIEETEFPDEWKAAIAETESAYRERVKVSALNRVKPAQYRRNIAVAYGNQAPLNLETDVALKELIQNETDPVVKKEWERAETLRTQAESVKGNGNAIGERKF